MKKQYNTFCGIDVSKGWLDVSIDGRHQRINQDAESIKQLIKKHLSDREQTLVILESTGGYERLATSCFAKAGLTVHVAHPNQVRHFAKAKGYLAKTDKMDSKVLAQYGEFMDQTKIRRLPTALEQKLRDLHSRLDQLKEQHQQESHRLGTVSLKWVQKSHHQMLKMIEKQMNGVKQQIQQCIESDEALYARYNRLQTMKGVGPALSMALTACLPELGEANKKEIAALVGVAPMTKDSGIQKGRGGIKNGRSHLRKILYMGALSAMRHDKKFKAFYDKLVDAGKPNKVAIVAVMRKMIVVLNAMIQHGEDYQLNV